jgi:hypothetical protein
LLPPSDGNPPESTPGFVPPSLEGTVASFPPPPPSPATSSPPPLEEEEEHATANAATDTTDVNRPKLRAREEREERMSNTSQK